MKIGRVIDWILYRGTEKPDEVKSHGRWKAMVSRIMSEYRDLFAETGSDEDTVVHIQ